MSRPRRKLQRAARAASWAALAALAATLGTSLRTLRPGAPTGAAAGSGDGPAWVRLMTVGLGGFRGLGLEVLWLRAEWLQDRGRYLELVQLAEWVAALDPHATEVWSYHAWNMAYNVSAMLPDPMDRLRWVTSGISLLRDRAIPLNRTEARLYRDLAWLYAHKIGSSDDDAHQVYKQSLAAAMAPLVGPDGRAPAPGTHQARSLQDDLALDASRMRSLEARFGPLDWRVPETHALYWCWQGLEYASGYERLTSRRLIQQALVTGIESGRLVSPPDGASYVREPNPGLIPATRAFFEESLHESASQRTPFAYFLALVVRREHARGSDEAARSAYDRLKAIAGDACVVPDFEILASGPPPPDFLAPVVPARPRSTAP